MDFDGTISTEVALWNNKAEYNDILTLGLPLSNEGKQLPSVIGAATAVVPKGAKNLQVAKEFLKYSIEPNVLAAYLKVGLGRFLPPMPSIVKNDPGFWLDPKTSHSKPIPGRACSARRSRPMRCSTRRGRGLAPSMYSLSR